MKITIEFDTTDAADAAALQAALSTGAVAAPAKAATKPKGETAAQKKKRLAAEKKAADDAAAAEADSLMDDGSGGEVTLDELKGVVKETIERTSIDAVKEVFKAHKAAKISDLASETYADVKAALEAL